MPLRKTPRLVSAMGTLHAAQHALRCFKDAQGELQWDEVGEVSDEDAEAPEEDWPLQLQSALPQASSDIPKPLPDSERTTWRTGWTSTSE